MSQTVTMLPRLSVTAIDHLLEGPADSSLGINASDLPDAISFGPVGGSPVQPEALQQLRLAIEAVARECGYPTEDSIAARARFDVACARLLADHPLLQSGEALRDDVWGFIATALLRPVSAWRYGHAPERFHGGVRNTFQRLWLRARAVDRGTGADDRWGLLEALTEDAFVAIVERPSIGGDHRLARAVSEAWLEASRRYGRAAMQPIMRRATILIRIRNEILALSSLPDTELAALLNGVFQAAAQALGRIGPDDEDAAVSA